MNRALGLAAILVACAATSAQATSIGPDTFGYRASTVAYAFEDIIGSGGVRLLGAGNDLTTSAALGFNFSFYGTSYSTVSFSSNGLLTFGQANAQSDNINLATRSPGIDVPTIAPLWDDWKVFTSAEGTYVDTRGTPGSRRFIVEWVTEHFDGSGEVTFEAILYESSNNILFQYQDVITGLPSGAGGIWNNGASATVGIRDTNGQANGRNLQWSFNQPVIQNGEAILFSPVPEPVTTAGLVLGIGSLAGYVRKRRA